MKNNQVKTVLVAFYNVYPPASGAASVSYNTAKFLPGEKYLFQLDKKNSKSNIGNHVVLISFKAQTNSHLGKTISLIRVIPRIVGEIEGIRPDVVVIEGASWTFYYLGLLYWLRLKNIGAKIIYHAHNVEYYLRRQKSNPLVVALTKWAERRLLTYSDISTAVSDVDACHFKRLYGKKPELLPNGVDVDLFKKVSSADVERVKRKYRLQGKIVLYMGLTTYGPNKEAIDFLISRVFPKVVEIVSKARLAIIGGDLSEKRSWLINPGSIPFEDIPAFIKACDACVAPVFSGSGTRLKILEYMAAGKPIITSSKGIEGLSGLDKNIFIAENEIQMKAQILSLLRTKSISGKNGRSASQQVEARYSWKKIIRDFVLTLENDKAAS